MRSLSDLQDLSGRAALVVGGSGHVGGTACETLAELGCAVAVSDLDEASSTERADSLAAGHGVATAACPADIADEAATRALPERAREALGGLDVLVHSAALVGTSELDGWAVPFDRQSAGAWDAALAVNLRSAFVLAQAARDLLACGGHGSVILLGSIYGVAGPDPRLYEGLEMANPAAYGASKAGIIQLARHLATEFAPDVRVNALSPGGIERGQPPEFVERYTQRTPLGRMASEEDLKGAIAYLASDLSAYVTGQNLLVDGGWTAW